MTRLAARCQGFVKDWMGRGAGRCENPAKEDGYCGIHSPTQIRARSERHRANAPEHPTAKLIRINRDLRTLNAQLLAALEGIEIAASSDLYAPKPMLERIAETARAAIAEAKGEQE